MTEVSNDKISARTFRPRGPFHECPQQPSAAEAEVSVHSCNEPLPHNAHHCLNIKTIFRKKQQGGGHRLSRVVCVHAQIALCFGIFVFTFVCINLRLCASLVCVCVCPTPPSLQSSYCSVTAGRRAGRKGKDLCLKSISLTPQTCGSFLCQKAKNIRKRTSCA